MKSNEFFLPIRNSSAILKGKRMAPRALVSIEGIREKQIGSDDPFHGDFDENGFPNIQRIIFVRIKVRTGTYVFLDELKLDKWDLWKFTTYGDCLKGSFVAVEIKDESGSSFLKPKLSCVLKRK
jgi:hypothetical protein